MAPRSSGPNEWGRRFDHLVERIQQRRPADVTAEEVEADITAARAEVRENRSANRTGSSRPLTSKHLSSDSDDASRRLEGSA